MKKQLLFSLFSFAFLLSQSAIAGSDTLQKEHSRLMMKASNFFSSNKSAIESRIKKTERFASAISQDTTGAKGLIKTYQSDSAFYKAVIQKGDSLLQNLQAHDKLVGETMKGELSYKFLDENEERIDNVKWIISYAKDTGKQVEKRLKSTYKELKEMRDDILKQKQKEQKKK